MYSNYSSCPLWSSSEFDDVDPIRLSFVAVTIPESASLSPK